MACEPGQKPKVIYQFQDGNQRTFLSKLSPIDVEVRETPIDATENYREEGYTIRFYSTNNYRNVEWIVKDYYIYEQPREVSQFRYVIRAIDCVHYSYHNTGVNIDPSTLTIDSSQKCPLYQRSSNKKCSIIVSHKGNSVFQDQGNCPCSYKIQCGNCPDGSIECQTNSYPGYCCIEYSQIKAEIAHLTAMVRRING